MRLIEIFESKTKKKDSLPSPRNPVAKHMKPSGAGYHSSKKFTRKVKHKKQDHE
jgi:hypothetical protein